MMIPKADQVACVDCDWLGDWRCEACGVGLCGRHRLPHYEHNIVTAAPVETISRGRKK
jgi:hypothetical protein